MSKGGIKEKDILNAIYKYASPTKTEVVLHIKKPKYIHLRSFLPSQCCLPGVLSRPFLVMKSRDCFFTSLRGRSSSLMVSWVWVSFRRVASAIDIWSTLVPSIEVMWSPMWRAPHLDNDKHAQCSHQSMNLFEQFLWHLMKVSGQCHKKDQGQKLYCKNRSLRKISLKKFFET